MTLSRTQTLLMATALATLTIADPIEARASTGTATWNPQVSEKLVKLPQAYLKKALDRDFQRSPLADAISNVETDIELKVETLNDLRDAAEQAEGDLQVELRHQQLAEKKAYVQLMQQRQDLKRKHLEKRRRVYQRILNKIKRQRGAQTPEKAALVDKQMAAQQRFEKTAETIDMKIFASVMAPQSRYSQEYAKNLGAANALLKAIASHPANRKSAETADPKNKEDYVRQLLTDAESSLALVTQEQEIVGYMAKLVALDATALAEQIEEETEEFDEPEAPSPVASALNHFIH